MCGFDLFDYYILRSALVGVDFHLLKLEENYFNYLLSKIEHNIEELEGE